MKRKLSTRWSFPGCLLFTLIFIIAPSGLLRAQTGTVTGVVKDSDNKPIESATVTVRQTNVSTITDEKGKFSITAEKGQTLVISHINFKEKTLVIGTNAVGSVTMETKTTAYLDDVVVVGYGTQKNRDITGSVATLGQGLIKDRPLTSVSVALQGTVSGVFINQNSGQAGKNDVVMRIRGVGTLNNSAPLVLIDGIEAPFDNISPDDVASITVLKDAASASIYGSRAANGVVLVTTKRGRNRNGKINFNYTGYYGVTKATRLPQMVTNSYQFATLRNEAATNFGNAKTFSDAALNYFQSKGPNTDWYDIIFNPGYLQQHSFGFDGGNDKTNYRLSLGYLDEKGVTLISGNKRLNGRLNLDIKPLDKILVTANISIVRGNRYSSQDDLLSGGRSEVYRAAESTPTFPAYDSLGRLANPNNLISGPSLGNPLGSLYGSEFKELSLEMLGSVGIEYSPLKGLTLSGTQAFNYRNANQETFNPSFSGFDFITGEETKYNILRGRFRSYFEGINTTLILKATYERTIGDYSFKLLAGFNQEDAKSNRFGAFRNGFLTNTVRVLSVGSPTSSTNFEGGTTWGLRSYFGRLNYNWQDKYLFEANVRADGTSRFQNKKWGTFPSFSAGWVVSNEKFYGPVDKVINLLKFRGSWGQLGNQIADPNDDFIYARQLNLSQNYSFGGSVVQGVAQTTLGNPDLTWETTTTSNVGVDLGLLNSKISLTADYFVRNTKDILFAIPISPLTGFNTQIENSAKVQNKGWELAATYTDKAGKFTFSIGGNVTHVTSTIQQLNRELTNGGADRFIYGVDGRRIAQRGSPLNALYGVQVAGIFQTQDEVDNKSPDHKGLNPNFGPGDLRFMDTNGDGKITNDDRVVIGKEDPTWLYGFNIDLKYMNFDLVALFSGAADFNSYASEEIARPFFGNASLEKGWLNRWTPQNNNTNIPRIFFTDGPATSINNSFWVLNRSYLRFKNLQIGYNLPSRILERMKISRVRIFVNGSNLFTITKFPYFDPERPAGKDRGQEGYPNLRVISGGINIGF